ncbi:general stress protein CsbD [Prauserella coralliicola]|nr:general stress protein CsbD [Prauserella coralliicola]
MGNRDEQQEGLKGAVEDIKGRVKESAGALFGNDQIQREGGAQQDKARAQQDIAEHEERAKQAERDAAAAEARERGHQ